MRSAKLKSLAKINLDLRVLNKREDGFHELRTVFQTISLADTIAIEYEKSKRTRLGIEGNIQIPDNLILRAAQAVLDEARVTAKINFRLDKKIPMGGGLGGGSSNAAAILIALPVLLGRQVEVQEIAAKLGSDVPFFLDGGTAVALGRGTESYPLADVKEQPILVVASGLHVATGPAYAALDRGLTFTGSSNKINGFQGFVRALGESRRADLACALSENDFEAVVFRQFPKLKQIRAKLSQADLSARMTGSGSAIFVLFESEKARERARKEFGKDRLFRGCELLPASLVSRRGYQRLWRRQLRKHIDPDEKLWPPQSRYAR
ncbi:MAG: 4-(cytidine 5'-diphospho)-2-C-methyl-D-erythritol kinase [Acidobacteriia bacterium]|nr:4-(cytidine 5'-diphospho)-2-C-methyl-D-erythritol kinase [Terriglobia bacterium]